MFFVFWFSVFHIKTKRCPYLSLQWCRCLYQLTYFHEISRKFELLLCIIWNSLERGCMGLRVQKHVRKNLRKRKDWKTSTSRIFPLHKMLQLKYNTMCYYFWVWGGVTMKKKGWILLVPFSLTFFPMEEECSVQISVLCYSHEVCVQDLVGWYYLQWNQKQLVPKAGKPVQTNHWHRWGHRDHRRAF